MENKNIAFIGIIAYILWLAISNIGQFGINFLSIIYFGFTCVVSLFVGMFLFKLWNKYIYFGLLSIMLFALTVLIFSEASSLYNSTIYYIVDAIIPNTLTYNVPIINPIVSIMSLAFIFSAISRLREKKQTRFLLILFIGSMFLSLYSQFSSLQDEAILLPIIGNITYFVIYFLVVAYLLGFIYKDKTVS